MELTLDIAGKDQGKKTKFRTGFWSAKQVTYASASEMTSQMWLEF